MKYAPPTSDLAYYIARYFKVVNERPKRKGAEKKLSPEEQAATIMSMFPEGQMESL